MSCLSVIGLLLLADLGAEARAASGITLLDPGQAPHRELRLDPKPGKDEWMRITMGTGMSMEMAGMPLPTPELPPIVFDVALKDLRRNDDGTFSYVFQFAGARAQTLPGQDSAISQAMQAKLSAMVGLTGTAKVSDTGEQLDWSFAPPSGLDATTVDTMRQSMRYSSSPFPEEPIGVGARWQVRQDLEHQGLRVQQVETLRLVEWTGDVAVIDIQIQQSAPEQAFQSDGIPPGASARLLTLDTRGQSRTRLNLGRLVPEEAQITAQSAFSIEFEAEGMTMPAAMKVDMNTRIEPSSKPKGVRDR